VDDIISVSLDSSYPAEAAQLVNSLVDAYVTFHSKRKRNSSAEVLAILQQEKVRHDEVLGGKFKAMVGFKKEHEALALETGSSNIILDRLARLSQAVTDAQLKALEAKADYETTKKLVSDPVELRTFIQSKQGKAGFISSGNEHLRLHKELDLDLLCRELDDLSSQVAADHPSMEDKKAKIKQIEMQLSDLDKKFAEAQLAVALQQYHSAQQLEKEVAKAFEEQKQMALTLNEQIAQYTLLESEWQQSQKVCELLHNRIKELNVTEDVGALNVSILEIARPADIPSGPRKGRILALALVLGIMSGGGLSLLKEVMHHG
jgi:polysaccharide biosynthesis transport protein